MKKITLLITILILLTGCGNKNNLAELYIASNELHEDYYVWSDDCRELSNYYNNPDMQKEIEEYYKGCKDTLNRITERAEKLDKLIKKSPDQELQNSWKEKKEATGDIFEGIKKFADALYSLDKSGARKNVSDLSDSELKELLKLSSYDRIMKLYEKYTPWYTYSKGTPMLLKADSEVKIFYIHDEIIKACKDDTAIVCEFEKEE